MTILTLHPRAAPKNKIRVWLCVAGALEQSSLVSLQWKLNDKVVEPATLRPLSTSHNSGSGLFTGVFEFLVEGDNCPFMWIGMQD